ncbi:phage tail protein [Rodentibacter pneumotropicus]|uniref:Phage tail protein n=1 Tax=Rodentibacter pneumotropicus TaxID=758 RepID=A0AAW5LB55_9PAST|nr:tail fiber protein [Rodentibacter pneumotropicus]MCQ9121254.1 phage tail protein [Rodentibacter pneumotropicus]
MANLKEQDKWEDGIYQIEENDPVLGGETGITNKPTKQLANRTLWLKKALELLTRKSKPKDLTADSASEADKDGHSHTLPKSSTSQQGIVQLDSATNSTSESKAATPKAIKTLKDLIDAITRNLGNYIPNSKKSNATNSASGDTVATSAAVKSANDNANGRVSKSGDTMTGDLSIKNGEYSKLKLYNASRKEFRFESMPDSSQVFGKASYRSEDGVTEYHAQYFPKKSGTIALTNEVLLNSGIQSIHGVLIAENVGSAWANYQWGAKQGKWRLEVHPDSHTAGNRRFNMVWSPNSGNPTYLSFPHIGDNGETVAYQSWIGQNYVKKSGDTMTGNLTINNGEPRLHGKRGGNNSWYVGLPNGTSDSLYLHSYASNTSLSLESDKINTTKPVFSAGNRTAVSLNGHNIQFRWNSNGNLDLKVDNTELGNIHYSNKTYVHTKTTEYGGISIERPSKNDRMLVESNGNKFSFIRRNLQTGSNHYVISTQEKSGTIAFVEDFTNPTFTLTNWANNGSSLNNITGTKFLSFGDEAIRGLGVPTGADWVGIQIADQGQQKTQIISAGYDNHYIRTNDDLSKNVWHLERLLTDVTLQRLVNRRDYSRTIKGTNDWDNGKQKDIAISGQVITYPDGRIQQIFHLKHFRMPWFAWEEHNIGYHQADRGVEIFLQLWSAMPNKIINIQAIASRSMNANTSANFYSEAGEYIFGWNLRKQGNNKDRIWINSSRARGGSDEFMDLYIVVEGY